MPLFYFSQMENLPPPWENCRSLNLKRYATYSRPACKEEYFVDYFINACGCQLLYMNDSNANYCTPAEMGKCDPSVYHSYAATKRSYSCPEPCEDLVYSGSGSQATLAPSVYEAMTSKYGESEAYWRENLAVLTVYFPELIVENIKHQKGFTVLSLFCNIGGVFGLVLGAGLISVIEIVDFCLSRIICRTKT